MIVQLLNGLAFGVLLLVLSSGLALIFGLRGVVNFAHGAFYMLAAYLAMTISGTVNFWVALIVTPLLMALLGVLLDRFGLRYLEDRPALDLVLLTFGVALVIGDIVLSVWGSHPYSINPPPGLQGSLDILGTSYPTYRLFVVVIGLVVGTALVLWLRLTRVGLYVRASSTRRVASGVAGVDIDRVSATVVGLGLGLAGLAGVLAGPYLALTPSMGLDILVLTFIVVIIGGLGSIVGAMIAALALGMINSFGSVYIPDVAQYVPYVLMLAVLLVRPLGVAGARSH
ncbi:MAG: branched-chain amino acid ABC transporter permease [Actinobacteria bacterium]|uniref:branched-chain amino acid ABC transporter permease n=1 Tax=Microbacterium sp. NPDC076895 TaxID=3154957 RepID=UPI0010031D50|nr:MAG: branched-chain amino acid ABC transporter permease [Actinomycetota bacterium]